MIPRIGQGLLVLFAFLLAACVPVGLLGQRYLLFNSSQSLPLGFYWRTEDSRAPYVWFCLAGSSLAEAQRHGLTMAGVCPNRSFPLLKRHYASTQSVVLTPQGFYIQGALLPNTAPKALDSAGRPLHHIPFGQQPSVPGTFWAISPEHRDSYDSRYFGPVPNRQILSYAQPLLTF